MTPTCTCSPDPPVTRRRLLCGLGALAIVGAAAPAQAAGELIIFAAASLKIVMDDAIAAWRAEGGREAIVAFASTPALVRQLSHGAPAHVFVSADADWMDYAVAKGLVRADTRVSLAGNTLVMVAPTGQARPFEVKPGFNIAAYLGQDRLAIAEVNFVPAGKYAKAALENLGAWDAVKSKLAQAENARAALTLVARGEAPLGIVYRSDAMVEPAVQVIAHIPTDSHPPIVYPAALTPTVHPGAPPFLAFLKSPKAQALFERHGFDLLP
jgi:molybdate transport system substrate-binding protein